MNFLIPQLGLPAKQESSYLLLAKANADRMLHLMMMARGAIVLDENLAQLAVPMKSINIHVVMPPHGMSDADIVNSILFSRIFVTKNTQDFYDYIDTFQIGLISVEGLKYIDGEKDGRKNKTVKAIHRVIVDKKLWSKKHGFLLTMKEDGKHILKNMPI